MKFVMFVMCMRVRVLLQLFVFVSVLAFHAGAASETNIDFEIEVRDKLTRRSIAFASVKVEALNDSTDSTPTYTTLTGQDGIARISYPLAAERFRITVSYQNRFPDQLWEYEPERVEYKLPVGKKLKVHKPGPIYLGHKQEKKLKEVSVTASKVMFYYNNDTLIYNADAFVLAEGSMLDALIEQLPGVKLKKNGEIFVKGKKVDNLLLNGKDLFNGNRELMLENLMAYTVKDVAVYNKKGFRSEALGINAGDYKYVMDVRLKRQYLHGFMVNAEAGYGTRSRYRGRLFGMWYSDNVGMTAFLSANNLNEDAVPKPGMSDGSWDNTAPKAGAGSYHSSGITYNAEGSEGKWKVKGDVIAKHSSEDLSESSTIRTFLPEGDNFEYKWSHRAKKSWMVRTKHELQTSLLRRAVITIKPQATYDKADEEDVYLSAMFNGEIKGLQQSMVEQIYSSDNALLDSILNRYARSGLSANKKMQVDCDVSALIKLRPSDGQSMLTVGAYANIENRNIDEYYYRSIHFGKDPVAAISTLQRNNRTPFKDRTYKAYAKLYQQLGFLSSSMELGYDYRREEQTRTSQLFQGDIRRDFLSPALLPQLSAELPPNIGQSYSSNERNDFHSVSLSYSLDVEPSRNSGFNASVHVPLHISQRNMDYVRGTTGMQHIHKSDILPDVKISLTWRWHLLNSAGHTRANTSLSLSLSSTVKLPQMLNLVDIIDDTDPMNLFLGNPDLKVSRVNHADLHFSYQSRTRHFINLNYTSVSNAVAQGSYYFNNTGQRIVRNYNVNGNESARLSYDLYWYPMGADGPLAMSNSAIATYNRSRALMGVAAPSDDEADYLTAPPVNDVNSYDINDRFDASLKIAGQHSLKAFVSMGLQFYNSPNLSISSSKALNCCYGVGGILNLPWNWGISTDISLYTRRGYFDSALNTTDILWNIRLTKSILKGKLVFAVDAYDVLHQLSNVSYTVNAQARVETVKNVIPNYVLFHIQYRFNKSPKK